MDNINPDAVTPMQRIERDPNDLGVYLGIAAVFAIVVSVIIAFAVMSSPEITETLMQGADPGAMPHYILAGFLTWLAGIALTVWACVVGSTWVRVTTIVTAVLVTPVSLALLFFAWAIVGSS